MSLVEKMLCFIDECDGSVDAVKKVLTAAHAVRDIRVPQCKKVSVIPCDIEEECETE